MTATLPAAGLHLNVPERVYREWPALNQSTLKQMARTPAHAKWEIDHPREPSPEMLKGTALHYAVLTPSLFSERIAQRPDCDRRTKEGKAIYAEFVARNEGKVILSRDDHDEVVGMAEGIRRSSKAMALLESPGACEASMVWRDPKSGLDCKGRADRITASGMIVELKSAASAEMDDFRRDIKRLAYHVQAAWYCWGHALATGTPATHAMIVVENTPPHEARVFVLDDERMATGAVKARRWLDRYARCLRSGSWPGYDDRAEEIGEVSMWDVDSGEGLDGTIH